MRLTEYWPRPTWLVIGVLSFSGIVTSLQQTLIIPLLSVFPTLLGSSVADTSWLVTVTLLVGAVATPILS
ncbi:MAG: transporter, partial [Microbacteriaceae bacterium]|nr:transporter [Microbacteriaceae bacterium]